MKKCFVVAVLLVSGITNAKEIPSPFWFSISEKILTETQNLFNSDVKEVAKVTKKKPVVTKAKSPLTCEQDEQQVTLPFPTFKRGSGLWMISE